MLSVTVMFEITNEYGKILTKHDNKVTANRRGAAQPAQTTTPTITPSSSIQHIAPTFSAKELAWGTGMDEYNKLKAKVTNFFTRNESNYIKGHMKQMIVTTMDAKWSKFVESNIKDDPPPQQTFLRMLQVVDEQMWVNHPQIRRVRRWLKVEINPNEPIYNYIARFETAMEDARTTSLTWENFNLLLIILGTKHDKFIEDVLKDPSKTQKN